MEHLFDLGGDLPGDYLVVSVASDEFFTLFSAQMAHIWTTTQNFTGAGNFETFHDNFSGLLFGFGHRL